ncbi:putative cytochrome P450 [Xylariaceae sp. FL0804]|nr:putative cytochrome P450 [Xylariaceae sp. FL0804]
MTMGGLQAWDLLGTLLLALLVYSILSATYNVYWHPLSKVPGPYAWSASRLPFIRSLLRGTLVHNIERLHRIYGPVLRIAPGEVTFAQAGAWADIFQARPDHKPFLKDPIWWGRQPGLPDSLISAIHPDTHARIRRTLAPGFTPRALAAQESILHRYTDLLVGRLAEKAPSNAYGAEFDIGPWFNFIAFDIFGDLGFGESFDCLQNSRYHPWIALLFNSVKAASFVIAARFYPLIDSILMRCIPPSLRKMQSDHYQQIVQKVQRRLNFELERPDIMSHVIAQDTAGNEGLSIGEINATFRVLTTAGSETTATVLGGTMNYLVNNRPKLETLTNEIRSRFTTSTEISLGSLRNLPYLNATINEGLRLCPPIPWMLPRRVPDGGDTVCGIWLPGGTPVSIQAYTINRDPANFHLATSFVPERWLQESTSNPKSRFFNDQLHAVQPFSVGPRSCMGQGLARAEMRLILAKLLWHFDFEAAEGKALRWEELRTFLLVEKKPIMVKLASRASI